MTDIVHDDYTDAAYLQDTAGLLHTFSSMLFLELTQEQIDSLRAIDWSAMAADAASEAMAEGYRGIGRYLSRSGANVRQDLAVEYARIFLGAGVTEEQLAVPFESVFTSPEAIMMQDARDDVVRIFRSQGMTVDASLNVPEDHISFELDFLAFMAERTASEIETQEPLWHERAAALVNVQASFIDEHVLNWFDKLASRVEASALSTFYPSVMKVLRETLKEHRAVLGEMAFEA